MIHRGTKYNGLDVSPDESTDEYMSEDCMPQPIGGLHHVTAIASDPQRNVEFYCEVLGLRLVKRTVNFDDPGSYHFYFGDDIGSPGTIVTFFAWPQASGGRVGTGETSAVAFSVPASSLHFWEKRILAAGSAVERAGERFGNPVLSLGDPDGMRIELVGSDNPLPVLTPRTSDIPSEYAIRGFDGVTLCEADFEVTAQVLVEMGFARAGQENNRIRFISPATAPGNRIDILVQAQPVYGHLGAGTVHHIAFRAPSDSAQLEWREVLSKVPLNVTPVRDRTYFHSIYFREPGGVLFEIATDSPGFAFDEPVEHLGEALKLPPWLEKSRADIERVLVPIELPHLRKEKADA
jgi:glyoxalase family protein